MLHCTCRDFEATHRLRGPNSVWYALGTKPACVYCGTGARAVIYRFLGDEYFKFEIDKLPVLTFDAINAIDVVEIVTDDPDCYLDHLSNGVAQESRDSIA